MTMTAHEAVRPSTFIGRTWVRFWSVVIGSVLALTAPTSLILLGWLMRQTRDAACKRAGFETHPTGWIMGLSGGGVLQRILGGLAANIREGFLAATSLLLATAPFAAAWLLSWWAGWENSFSKGYEQAFVGPALGISGILIFALTMIYLPMALAHQAVEARAFALFEYRRVKNAVRHSGWAYVWLAAATVFLALPIFGSRMLIVFSEAIYPGIADLPPDQITDLQSAILLARGAYVLVTLTFLRRWIGRIYADAVMRACQGSDSHLWTNSALAPTASRNPYRGYFIGRTVRFSLLFALWISFAFMLYFSQFMNHSWLSWVTQPYIFLPWVF